MSDTTKEKISGVKYHKKTAEKNFLRPPYKTVI